MATKPRDINYYLSPWHPQGMVNRYVKFPSICPAFLEKIFEGFNVNPRWLPDRVTFDITVIRLSSTWLVNHLCEVSL